MRVLITGGLGFIGSHLAKECLKRGDTVEILSRSEKKISNVEAIKDSISLKIKELKDISKEDVEHVDAIYHLAGSTDNYAIIEDEPYRDIDANCNGTIALLEACRRHNPNVKIVFASTFFVNGNVSQLPVTPDSPCNPLGLYGATRLAAEHFCHVYHKVFGLNIVIARFTNVFGPFEQSANKKKAGFNYLINLALKGEEIPLYSNGDFVRDYIYVTDVADACIALAEKGEADAVYYVGRGEHVKFKALVDIIVSETGANVRSIEPPQFHKNVGIVDFVCDNSGLKKMGWTPKVSLEDGIKRTIAYYKEQG